MSFSGVRALVTGGAGFIGSHLVDRLIEREAEVMAVDDFSTGEETIFPPYVANSWRSSVLMSGTDRL